MHFVQVLRAVIRNADIYFNLGVLYAEKEKWDQAKAGCNRGAGSLCNAQESRFAPYI